MHATADPKGYYRILAVPRNASPEEIRTAFRERAKLYHPDHGGELADDRRFRLLREAYEVLRDPQRRLQYDAEGLKAPPREGPAAPRWPSGAGSASPHGRARPRPSARPFRIRMSPSTLLMGALGTALLIVMALWWSSVRQLELRTLQVSQLSYRLNDAAVTQAEGRARRRGTMLGSLDQAAGTDQDGEFEYLYSTAIDFAAGQTQLDERLEGKLRRSVTELATVTNKIPAGRGWVILVDGHAIRSVSSEGVEAAAWETALLRIGAVVNFLARAGLPPERLASRFLAGSDMVDPRQDDGRVVEVRLLCCAQ